MSSPSSNHQPSLASIQKAKTVKNKPVLPKSSLIQIYLDNNNQPSRSTIDHTSPGSHIKSTSRNVLPKFNTNDIIKNLNLIMPMPNQQPVCNQTLIKRSFKEKKFKELTRICLNSNNQNRAMSNSEPASELPTENNSNEELNSNLCTEICAELDQLRSKKSLVQHLAREFFLDCKQRLDTNTFKVMLTRLNEFKQASGTMTHNRTGILNLVFTNPFFFLILIES
jgi:hypothetical protein